MCPMALSMVAVALAAVVVVTAVEASPRAAPRPSLPSSPTRVCLLQAGMLWLDREPEGPPGGTGSEVAAGPPLPRRSCSEVGRVRSDSWLLEERRHGSRPVADVRSDEWRLLP